MSGRVIRVAPRSARAPNLHDVVQALPSDTRLVAAAPEPVRPVTPPEAQQPPVINVQPPAVNVDTTELAKQLALNNELLKQVLAELKRKKNWQFDLLRDAIGRPTQINASEV